jgi:Uma2 family endonuclease
MAGPKGNKYYTRREYYALEDAADYKSDYFKGEIFAMSGGAARHSVISANIAAELRHRLKGAPCRAYESNLRLYVKAAVLICYPMWAFIAARWNLITRTIRGRPP